MAAHQIIINPLSGGIGTAPAGIVPYASDMWGVDAVTLPQVGTPSANSQATLSPPGMARRPATGTLTLRFTGKISPSATVRVSRWGKAACSFSLVIEAGPCPSRCACGTATLTSRRDVILSGLAELPALSGEPAIASLAAVVPEAFAEDASTGQAAFLAAVSVTARALSRQPSWGEPLAAFGWDTKTEGIPARHRAGLPGLSHLVEVCPDGADQPSVCGAAQVKTAIKVETLPLWEKALPGFPAVQSLAETFPAPSPYRPPSWGGPLVAFGWDAELKGIPAASRMGHPCASNHIDVRLAAMRGSPAVSPARFHTTANIGIRGIREEAWPGLHLSQSTVETFPPGIPPQVVAGANIQVESTALAMPAGILVLPAVPPLFEVRTETYLITLLEGRADTHENVGGTVVYTATPIQGLIIPTTRLEGLLNILVPIEGMTRSIM